MDWLEDVILPTAIGSVVIIAILVISITVNMIFDMLGIYLIVLVLFAFISYLLGRTIMRVS